jgi:hypothetical protein
MVYSARRLALSLALVSLGEKWRLWARDQEGGSSLTGSEDTSARAGLCSGQQQLREILLVLSSVLLSDNHAGRTVRIKSQRTSLNKLEGKAE